jgi:hypothetical protein
MKAKAQAREPGPKSNGAKLPPDFELALALLVEHHVQRTLERLLKGGGIFSESK